jgi:hypothetical protein
MKRITKISLNLLVLTFFTLGCREEKKKKTVLLVGSWSKVQKDKNEYFDLPFNEHFGLRFSDTKIELFNGFIRYERDSTSGVHRKNYKGLTTRYEVRKDSIFIKDPFSQNWKFSWRIKKLLKNTLVLEQNNSTFIELKRITSIPSFDFDQIVFSRSGCYGSCPVLDISLHKNGEVYYQGEGYIHPLGFYRSKTNSAQKTQIFSKFRNIAIDSLSDVYSAGHTDDETITTTFIKNGRIIKTIYDYGKSGPKELVWAYVPIENLYTQLKFDSIPNDDAIYPKLYYHYFQKDSKIVTLEKSESFYLSTEIQKSKIVQTNFQPEYQIRFTISSPGWMNASTEKKTPKIELVKIVTDGRLFKFSFKNHKSITRDLGYNFISRNFTQADFKLKTAYH